MTRWVKSKSASPLFSGHGDAALAGNDAPRGLKHLKPCAVEIGILGKMPAKGARILLRSMVA